MDNPPRKMDYPLIPMAAKSSGFPGQRLIVVHPAQLARALRLELLRPFCPTDIGFFPSAAGHNRKRPSGSSQTIFIYCVEGSGWCEIGGTRHAVHPDDLLVIPSRCPHAYGASEKAPWSIEWFHATGSGVGEYLRRMEATPRSPVLALRPDVWDSSLFDEALSGMEAGFTDTHLLHAAKTLGHLLGKLAIRQRQRSSPSSSAEAKIEKAISHLRIHHEQPLTVPSLASLFGFSTSHFASLFLQHTGHPPMDYLIRVRIGHACSLLDLTSLSVKEIAAKVGYSDPYYFSRVFKKVTGCSPRAYREMSKG